MKTGPCKFVHGYTGGGYVAFHANISGRDIAVEVPADTIKSIAKALQHTDHVGHAVWHVNNPEQPMPCSSCKKERE